jgi:hypothetical protein
MTGPPTVSINHCFKSRTPHSTQYVVMLFLKKVLVCEWEQYPLISVIKLLWTSQRTLTLHILCIYHLPPRPHITVSILSCPWVWQPSRKLHRILWAFTAFSSPAVQLSLFQRRASKCSKFLKDEEFVCDKHAVLRGMVKRTFNTEMPQHRPQRRNFGLFNIMYEITEKYDGCMKQSFLRSEYLFSCSTNNPHFKESANSLMCSQELAINIHTKPH